MLEQAFCVILLLSPFWVCALLFWITDQPYDDANEWNGGWR